MDGMSRTEQYTAIVVGIDMYFLFEHFQFIPSSFLLGRLASKAALVFGAGLVILIWPFIVRKKKDGSGAKS